MFISFYANISNDVFLFVEVLMMTLYWLAHQKEEFTKTCNRHHQVQFVYTSSM